MMTANNSPREKKTKRNDSQNGNRRTPPPPNDNFDWKKASRTMIVWILIIIVAWVVLRQLNVVEEPERQKSYTQYRSLLERGQISSADIIDHEFHGTLIDGGNITTVLPYIDSNMLAEWDSLKIDYSFREKTTSWFGVLITSILPWVIIIAFWLYIMRRMQGGGTRGIFSFGKSRAKLLTESKRRFTFKDVAGCDEAKEELSEVIAFLQDPKKFSRLGGRIPTGALLLGPPGTGKTLLARAVAGEADVPFYSMSGADFVEMFVGVGASRVRDLFEQGKKNAPCIIFIDEIDAVGRHRGAGLGGGHDEREQTLNQLLVEMDGFESNDGVILLAATNRPDVLDPALIRPGRFDRQIVVDHPDVRGREGILRVHTKKIPLANDVKLDVLAKGTPGLVGADIENIVNEAALLAARRNANKVSMADFENAKDKVMMGVERKSLVISDEEKRQTAYHEAGHVLVAKMTPGTDPVHKVTIIPRGRALGLTHYLPISEKRNYSRSYLLQSLVHLLGGRAAERITFNELSTGAGNDIERATEIARKMICEWGMSDKVGPVSLGRKNQEIFLGRDFAQQRDYSERTAQDIDDEIRRIVREAEKRAEKIIRQNLDKLKLIAESLLEREILDGSEIDMILEGGTLPPRTKAPTKSARRPRHTSAANRSRPKATRPKSQTTRPKPQTTRAQSKTQQTRAPTQAARTQPRKENPPQQTGKSDSKGGSSDESLSPSQSRRQLARSFGVVRYHDRHRRPFSRTTRTKKPDDPAKSDSRKKSTRDGAPPVTESTVPDKEAVAETEANPKTSSRRPRRRRPRRPKKSMSPPSNSESICNDATGLFPQLQIDNPTQDEAESKPKKSSGSVGKPAEPSDDSAQDTTELKPKKSSRSIGNPVEPSDDSAQDATESKPIKSSRSVGNPAEPSDDSAQDATESKPKKSSRAKRKPAEPS
ncbi:MAG: ATP-dependent zinc metalloprotease FtsH, partial [Candidatus Electryoneaceae bacterium]|nr:ATP-dependent zinc metalloprotease FtsH [Candidatus Electryoneaceae bacterium]